MILYKLSLAITDGLIFTFFSLGIYVAFNWLKFPDLTPDGSFVLGAIGYFFVANIGVNPLFGLFIAFLFASLAGCFTALLNQILKVPAFISGLLTSSALYSVCWILLAKPNQFLEKKITLLGESSSIFGQSYLLVLVAAILFLCVFLLFFFGNSIWGLRLRGIGENNNLSSDSGSSMLFYYILGLGLANGLVGISGALFIQRSFYIDINMGVGQTIVGLIGVMLGVLIARSNKSLLLMMFGICIGTIVYKIMIWLNLEMGLPAYSFKLVSALILVSVFVAIAKTKNNFLSDLRWK